MTTRRTRTWTRRGPQETIRTVPETELADLLHTGPVTLCGNGLNYSESSLLRSGTNLRVLPQETPRFATHPTTGELEIVCDGGSTLGDALAAARRAGRHLPVLPGRLDVTVGGAIAHDVHGKNHVAAGSFGEHVNWIDLLTPAHGLLRVSASEHPEIFRATIAGCGLTGGILRAGLATAAGQATAVHQYDTAVTGTAAIVESLLTSSATYRYAALLLAGEQTRAVISAAELTEARTRRGAGAALRLPRCTPGLDTAAGAARLVEELRYRSVERRTAPSGQGRGHIVTTERFLAPLGVVANWNLLIGRRGFAQQQCSLPAATAIAAIEEIRLVLAASGTATHFATLRALRGTRPGLLSCAVDGVGLTFDMLDQGTETAVVCRAVEEITIEAGGRFHLAKNAYTTGAQFASMFHELEEFRAVRRHVDPNQHLTSELARRVGL
jgi:decaprenylphospho-beta-D-ribofuranose 2-oxidase